MVGGFLAELTLEPNFEAQQCCYTVYPWDTEGDMAA